MSYIKSMYLSLDGVMQYDVITAKQMDIGRKLKIWIKDNSSIKTLDPNIISAHVRAVSCAGEEILNECVVEDNNIIVELTQQMLIKDGVCPVDIVVLDKSDSSQIATGTFMLKISKAVHTAQQITAQPEYTSLLNKLVEVDEAVAVVGNIAEKETERVEAEEQRDSAENIRVTNENERIAKELLRPDYVYVTQAEYDALPLAQKQDPNIYYEITDDDGQILTELQTLLTDTITAKEAAETVVLNKTAVNDATTSTLQSWSSSKIASQLSEKTSKTYVDTKVSGIASGAPKGFYNTLAALQTAYPTGNSNNYVVPDTTDTTKGYIYYWNGTQWTNTNILYQSNTLADKSVTRNYLQFTDMYATMTSGSLTVNTTNKTITMSSGVMSTYRQGVLVSEYACDYSAIDNGYLQIHIFYNSTAKTIEVALSPYTDTSNDKCILGILYKGKIYNTIDKNIWTVDGIPNGGWGIGINDDSVTQSNIGFAGLSKAYVTAGSINIDTVNKKIYALACTITHEFSNLVLGTSDFNYTDTNGYLILNTINSSLNISSTLINSSKYICLGYLLGQKLYSYSNSNITINKIGNAGFGEMSKYASFTGGTIVVDTVNKTIASSGTTIVITDYKQGTVIPAFNVNYSSIYTGKQLHIMYNISTKTLEVKESPLGILDDNYKILGILYSGKIFNTIDKGLWIVNGIENGGWGALTATEISKVRTQLNATAFKFTLPTDLYIINNDTFSVYYKNIIKYSGMLDSGDYYVKVMKKSGSVYSALPTGFIAYDYKLDYTPNLAVNTTTTTEFRIINTYTNEVVASKVVNFNVVMPTTSKSIIMNTIGDSFTDSGVTKSLYAAIKSLPLNIEFVGLNSGNVTEDVNVKDDAYSGEGFIWYTQYPLYNNGQLLRSDRPLKDATWDVGWGLNETNGWTEGQTYADLTTEQRSHGKTKNSFWNPTTSSFDYSYHVNTFLNDGRYGDVIFKPIGNDTLEAGEEGKTIKHITTFTSFAGLNDVIWMDKFYTESYRTELIGALEHIIASVWTYDPNIKIFISTVTPQRENDESIQKLPYFDTANYKHYKKSKYCQELWNEILITTLTGSAYTGKPIYIIPTAAHFDTRFSFNLTTVTPNKFDNTYTETICSDIHPNATGYNYIADCAKNFIYAKS